MAVRLIYERALSERCCLMANLYYDLSKYIMAVLFVLYTLESFVSMLRNAKRGYLRQYVYIFLIHLSGFFVLCLKNEDSFYLLFFAVQQAALIALRNLYQAIYPKFSRLILNHMCMFLCTGMIIISRISMAKAMRQFAIIVVSMAIGLAVPFVIKEVKQLRKLTWVYAALGVIALGVVLLLGAATNGSKISYSVFGFTFQPSEFVKLLFIFFLAAFLSSGAGFLKIVLASVISLGYIMILVASTDLGSAAIFFVIYVFMIYIASGKFRYVMLSGIAGIGGCIAAYKMFYHIKVRVASWLNPWRDITGKGYQMVQSLFAIGTGGWFGFGLCQGKPESIPFVEADFIFSAIAEEMGVIYGISLILLCLSCFLSFIRLAYRTGERFYQLLAYGIAVTYIFQVFLTIGGGIKFIPLTGVTLPLISYGGSSVMVTILMFSVMQGIALRQAQQAEEVAQAQEELAELSEEIAEPAQPEEKLAELSEEMTESEAEDAHLSAQIAEPKEEDVHLSEEIAEPEAESAAPASAGGEAAGTEETVTQASQRTKGTSVTSAWQMRMATKRQTAFTASVFSALFMMMVAYIVFFMRVQREDVVTHPYNVTRQQALAALNVRGTIKTEDGTVLAYTKLDEDGNEVRRYPYGTMFSHVVGYASKGGMGIEASMGYNLVSCHQSIGEMIVNDFSNQKNRGDTVITTLDPSLQELAYRFLGAESGAIVVMEPSTGKILAMVSKPDFDPNEIEGIWDELLADKDSSVLVNRATQGLYPPGSTFKIFTALEYIREHPTDYDQYTFPCKGYFRSEDGTNIYCYRHGAHGRLSLEGSFAHSCNSSFANIGMTLDRGLFGKTLEDFYFNQKLPGDFTTNMSRTTINAGISDYDMMQSSIGQGETLVTPLQICMATCAIANGGEMMTPYVVSRIENYEGGLVRSYQPQSCGRVMSQEEADALTELMVAVCDYGTGYRIAREPYTVAGKTGSAEFSDSSEESHAWFTAFAPADDPKIAVTIVIEGVGSGSNYAVPIAQRLFQTYFDEIDEMGE